MVTFQCSNFGQSLELVKEWFWLPENVFSSQTAQCASVSSGHVMLCSRHCQHANTLLRGVFCQFPFRWIYYCHNSKSTRKETGKTHLCALVGIGTKKLWRHVSSVPLILLQPWVWKFIRRKMPFEIFWPLIGSNLLNTEFVGVSQWDHVMDLYIWLILN